MTLTDKQKVLLLIASFVLSVFVSYIFSSCNPVKKAEKHINKAYKEDKATVARKMEVWFPCIPLATDTLYDSVDNIVFVECDSVFTHDSLIEYIPVKKYINVPCVTKTIIKTVEDSSKTFLAYKTRDSIAAVLNNTQDSLKTARATISTQKAIIKHKGKENWIWRIIALVLIGWQGIKIYNRLSKPLLP